MAGPAALGLPVPLAVALHWHWQPTCSTAEYEAGGSWTGLQHSKHIIGERCCDDSAHTNHGKHWHDRFLAHHKSHLEMNRTKVVKIGNDDHPGGKSGKLRTSGERSELKRALFATALLFAVIWVSYTVGTWNGTVVVQVPASLAESGKNHFEILLFKLLY